MQQPGFRTMHSHLGGRPLLAGQPSVDETFTMTNISSHPHHTAALPINGRVAFPHLRHRASETTMNPPVLLASMHTLDGLGFFALTTAR